MKKVILILTCVFLTWAANAQYTITAASNPSVGEISSNNFYKSPGTIMPSAGTNILWDYSNLGLSFSSVGSVTYVPASSVQHYTAFPQMNMGVKKGPTSYIAGYYDNYKAENLGWSVYAGACTYSTPVLQMVYPFSYGSFTTAPYGFNSFSYKESGNVEISGIGTGTLAIANYTFADVLLVKTKQDGYVFYPSTSIIGTPFTATMYNFYSALSKEPVFGISTFFQPDFLNNADTTIRIKSIYSPVGITELQKLSALFNVFPNPANEDNLKVSVAGINSDYSITIQNSDGKTLYSDYFKGNSGETPEHDLDISLLKPGVYFITLNSGEGRVTRKLIIP